MDTAHSSQVHSPAGLRQIDAEEMAQDSFEYLLIVGGIAIAIVAATIVMATGGTGIVSGVGDLISDVLS